MLRQICHIGESFAAYGTGRLAAREAVGAVAAQGVGVGVGLAAAGTAAAVWLRVGQCVTVGARLPVQREMVN